MRFLRTPRALVKGHAVISSLVHYLQDEVFQSQLSYVSSSRMVSVLQGLWNDNHMSFLNILLTESVAIGFIGYFYWLSFEYFQKSKIYRLDSTIQGYRHDRQIIQICFTIFAFVFLRNVENAI